MKRLALALFVLIKDKNIVGNFDDAHLFIHKNSLVCWNRARASAGFIELIDDTTGLRTLIKAKSPKRLR